jgi:hypothetical protein
MLNIEKKLTYVSNSYLYLPFSITINSLIASDAFCLTQIDWYGGLRRMKHLEVKTNKLSFILMIVLGIIFVPLSLLMMVNGLLNGFKIVPIAIGLMMLIIFGAVLWLIRRGHSKTVKYFSDDGLTRNDGRNFAWADLSGVVNQVRITSVAHGTKSLWRTEIHFKNGEAAWLLPTKISNLVEVREFVHRLPCEHTEVIV